jgi:hypothetical protein
MDQDQKTRLWTIHMEPMLAARNRPSVDIIVHIHWNSGLSNQSASDGPLG